jgi:anti-anti-sigma factor
MTYRQISVERHASVLCVRLRKRWLNEGDLEALGEELNDLLTAHGCRKLALSLRGLDAVCSTLLGKLIATQRRLLECRGTLVLCDATPDVLGIFAVCRLERLFQFVPDKEAAIAALAMGASADVA